MASKVLKVGIAGQGRSGYGIHADWLRQAPGKFKIVAVSDEIPQRLAQAKEEFSCRTYKNYHQLIADNDIDLLINALPSHLHPKGTTEALRAGHNVVCEKPLAVKVKDFDQMTSAARKARKLFAPYQNARFSNDYRKVQEVIASGVLGRILHVRIMASGFKRRWDWQTRQDFWGGNLNNTGPHFVDQAVMFFGAKTPKVFCKMESAVGSSGDADDFCALTLHGKGSPTVEVLLSSYLAFGQGDKYSVSGTLGGLAGGGDHMRWRYYDPSSAPKRKLDRLWSNQRRYCGEKLPWVNKTWTRRKTKVVGFGHMSRAFYNNIHDVLTGKGKLEVTPAQVRRQIAVIEECHRQNRLPKS